MTEENLVYLNALNMTGQIGPARYKKIRNNFTNLREAWQSRLDTLAEIGLEESTIETIGSLRNQINPEKEYQKLEQQNIRLLSPENDDYPKLLKEIPDPPPCLYIKGRIIPQDDMAVAIVGSRQFTQYGHQVAEDLARDLVRSNITVVSGLALGIDAFAHRTAVDYDGRTIAVLACGLDNIYPSSNRGLAEKILEDRGAIISEMPLGTPPLKHHFISRNRIISGLALGTVVVEAKAESGALITAQHALDQNRQVFAVPGSIYNPNSEGPLNLLKMGAKPVTHAVDIIEDLNLSGIQEQIVAEQIVGDNEHEQKILNILSKQPTHADEITKSCSLPPSVVAATLTIMEMKGKIKNLGASQYILGR